MRQVLVSGWLLAIACGLSGCATRTLWENHAFDGFNEPARPANLRVFRTHDDWLVRYDEVNENTDRTKQRAYYVMANDAAIKDHKRPHFVHFDLPEFHAVRTVISADGQQFTLYEGEERLGPYELPVYPAGSGRVKQVLLTPGTLIADATIIGGYLWVYWMSIGAPPLGTCY